MNKIFSLESRDTYHGKDYRFFSLFNGTRGAWCGTKENAIKEGKQHQNIVTTIYPELLTYQEKP